ncbi:MAG: hypothetical protein GTN64_05570 [Candidatus Latescibacteria bacterium]|nr:hypothetical protein [Candidatus Latescibacterota bacterium]NIO78078.1 hypothetical protein [Candidatus Latescibacterota bacterium]
MNQVAIHPQANAIPTTVSALAAVEREKSTIEASLVVAHKCPRNMQVVESRVLEAFSDYELADISEYEVPRGNESVTGPSVHAMRAIARCFGNLNWGWEPVDTTDEYVMLQAWAHDLESNSRVTLNDRFRKLIKRGQKWVTPNEFELQQEMNRRGALIERKCLERVLPPGLVQKAMRQGHLTLESGPQVARSKRNKEQALMNLVVTFSSFGVTIPQLEMYVGKPIAEFDAPEIASLKQTSKNIKEGMSQAAEIFSPQQTTIESVEVETEPEEVNTETGEVIEKGDTDPDT